MTIKLRVSFSGPMVTVQDAGRVGHMRFGVPASGPMDRRSFAIANALLGNPADAAGIEVSLGGIVLENISDDITLAVAGGAFNIQCGEEETQGWGVFTLRKGQKLTIRAGDWGSWCYVVFAGKLKVSRWLDSAATHFLSGLGGGAVSSGQVLEILDHQVKPERQGIMPCPAFLNPKDSVDCVIGPQDHHFDTSALDSFTHEQFQLSDAYDRMGVRLDGPSLPLKQALSIPSEPILRGSVQVDGSGTPTVLLADHQTTGGYPKIATLLSSETDQFAQHRSGDTIRFNSVAPQDALELSRTSALQFADYISDLAKPRLSLDQKLLGENLISVADWE